MNFEKFMYSFMIVLKKNVLYLRCQCHSENRAGGLGAEYFHEAVVRLGEFFN